MRARRALVTVAVLASACSQPAETIPNPSPAPDSPATTEGINPGAQEAAPTTEASTTVPDPIIETSTTAPAPVLCPRLPHPEHHNPCPATTSTVVLRQQSTKPATSSTLARIRACESGGDYTTDTGNGYYGAYQFSPGTWRSVGGSGNPAHASPAEQDMRAQMMIDAGRRGEWPNC